jgi:hypothetical protein
MEEQLNQLEEETFLVLNNIKKSIEFITSTYELAELVANKLAIKNDASYTICKYIPIDIESLEIKPYIQVRMSYNKDYDDYTLLSIKERDKEKEDSIITSDDDESITMSKMYIKYEDDTYDSIIEKAKAKMQKLIKES